MCLSKLPNTCGGRETSFSPIHTVVSFHPLKLKFGQSLLLTYTVKFICLTHSFFNKVRSFLTEYIHSFTRFSIFKTFCLKLLCIYSKKNMFLRLMPFFQTAIKIQSFTFILSVSLDLSLLMQRSTRDRTFSADFLEFVPLLQKNIYSILYF